MGVGVAGAPVHRFGPDTPARLRDPGTADCRHGVHGWEGRAGWLAGRAVDGVHAAGLDGGAAGSANRTGHRLGAPGPELVAPARGRQLAVAALRVRRHRRIGSGLRRRSVHHARDHGERVAREGDQGDLLPRRRQLGARPARQRGLPQPGPGPAAHRLRGRALARRTPHRRPAAADGSADGRVPGARFRRRRTRQCRRFRERHRIRPDRSRSAPPQPRPRRDATSAAWRSPSRTTSARSLPSRRPSISPSTSSASNSTSATDCCRSFEPASPFCTLSTPCRRHGSTP